MSVSSTASLVSMRTSAIGAVKFKLGQDERDTEYADILAALASGTRADTTLLEWMHRSNTGRGRRTQHDARAGALHGPSANEAMPEVRPTEACLLASAILSCAS